MAETTSLLDDSPRPSEAAFAKSYLQCFCSSRHLVRSTQFIFPTQICFSGLKNPKKTLLDFENKITACVAMPFDRMSDFNTTHMAPAVHDEFTIQTQEKILMRTHSECFSSFENFPCVDPIICLELYRMPRSKYIYRTCTHFCCTGTLQYHELQHNKHSEQQTIWRLDTDEFGQANLKITNCSIFGTNSVSFGTPNLFVVLRLIQRLVY